MLPSYGEQEELQEHLTNTSVTVSISISINPVKKIVLQGSVLSSLEKRKGVLFGLFFQSLFWFFSAPGLRCCELAL